MANKGEKKYRKIRKAHIWSSIVEFLLFTVAATFILIVALAYFGSYVIDTKIASEYEKILTMSRLYESGIESGDRNIYNLLKAEGRDYLITDAQGSILYADGTDTRSGESGTVLLPGYDEEILVYRDVSRSFIYPGESGRLTLDLAGFARWMSSDEDEEDKDPELALESNRNLINLPLWLVVEIDGGRQFFVGKAIFSTGRRDVMMFTALVVGLIILLGIIMFTILGAGIKNFIRQRRMLSLFFDDVVTEGRNRTYLLVKGERMLRRKCNGNNRFAIVSLLFVNYNTFCICHSVQQGNQVLGRIYRAIEKKLDRREMIGHCGAGDFGLILHYEDERALRIRLEGIISELEQIDSEHKFFFQAGVAFADRATDEEGRSVRSSELDFDTEYSDAMAARMSLGGGDESGIAFFDDKLIKEQQWLDQVQERQRAALDSEEFLVYYQPKYDPRTSELRGAEALIRWNSPEFGLVPPGKFIPIFEKNGFITEIDHYMIRHVAADQKKWLDQGLKCVPVSVNVSRAHFIESDLAEQICRMVDQAGTPHELIEIELTESAFFDDKKAMINTINKLKGYGFAVSMDDFGSGYSSLNSLKDMPLDVLKLDAEFFRGETSDRRGEIVVAEAIKLAKNLNMRIVAEGVEVKEQVDFLAAEDCDMIQGYYFAKPMPGSDYEEKMKAGRSEKPAEEDS
ncbi:MAG: EAL domain-containing protein [Lachnospiraceae bacterium]|nr:EAL domain-containing protein [Lachnospiraceae bacterium]